MSDLKRHEVLVKCQEMSAGPQTKESHANMNANFNIPSTIILGGGASDQLVAQVQRLGARRALLVTDAYLQQNGLAERFAGQLRAAGVETAVFAGVQPDPTAQNVMDGLGELQRCRAEVVIGLGGGSPMDAAKIYRCPGHQSTTHCPVCGLPQGRAAGTAVGGYPHHRRHRQRGDQGGRHYRHRARREDDAARRPSVAAVALVDYELTMTMPPALTAHVGVDTLTHAIEAYVSRRANPLTDPIALSCIRLVADASAHGLPRAGQPSAREAMMTAACQGGMAFSNSSVCLVHGMSRPIGAHFHVPHGLSNAVLLPDVTRFSLPGAPARYAAVARVMGMASVTG